MTNWFFANIKKIPSRYKKNIVVCLAKLSFITIYPDHIVINWDATMGIIQQFLRIFDTNNTKGLSISKHIQRLCFCHKICKRICLFLKVSVWANFLPKTKSFVPFSTGWSPLLMCLFVLYYFFICSGLKPFTQQFQQNKHKPFVLYNFCENTKKCQINFYCDSSEYSSIGIPIPTCPYGIGKPRAWEWLTNPTIFSIFHNQTPRRIIN